jgi:hypothetical protein
VGLFFVSATSMQLDKEKAKRVFRLVRDLEDVMRQYCKDKGESIPVPWENAVDSVEQMVGIKIKVERKLTEAQEPNGMILRYSDKTADIKVRRGLTDDMENFTIVKEAMQLLVDEEGDLSTDVAGTLTHLRKSSWFSDGDGKDDLEPVLHSEHLSTIAAAAAVVPRSRRADYIAAVGKGETTIAKIAAEINVPEHIVELALDPSFIECCEEALATEPMSELAVVGG